MRIKLVKKLALCLNGVDLTPYKVGDVFACNDIDAHMLLAEGWACLASDDEGIDNEPPEPSVSSIIESFRAGKKERRLA